MSFKLLSTSFASLGRFQCGTIVKRSISNVNYDSPPCPEPVRQVFVSQSSDIFTNLALEDWLYRNHDFEHKQLLLLWRNKPCVVIGRHQESLNKNPWLESNVPFLRENNISLARRNSGGGTVYHDLGNINCTFFTKKSEYQRRKNLNIICEAIKKLTCLDVAVNDRDDVVLNKAHKISGTAAKIGKDVAYHHCTVLVDVNECVLHDALNSHAVDLVETRATQSVKVPVRNLKKVDPSVDVNKLQETIGWQFLRTGSDGVDRGMEAASQQRGFQLVRPDDGWFPGINRLKEDLQGYNWVFGKTPKFKVNKSFDLPEMIFPTVPSCPDPTLQLEIEVYLGVIQDVRVRLPLDHFDPDLDLSDVMHGLVFGKDVLAAVREALEVQPMAKDKREFIYECVKKMIGKFV